MPYRLQLYINIYVGYELTGKYHEQFKMELVKYTVTELVEVNINYCTSRVTHKTKYRLKVVKVICVVQGQEHG
jgi:hypothetical protein